MRPSRGFSSTMRPATATTSRTSLGRRGTAGAAQAAMSSGVTRGTQPDIKVYQRASAADDVTSLPRQWGDVRPRRARVWLYASRTQGAPTRQRQVVRPRPPFATHEQAIPERLIIWRRNDMAPPSAKSKSRGSRAGDEHRHHVAHIDVGRKLPNREEERSSRTARCRAAPSS